MSGKDLIGDVLSHGLTAIVDETIDYMPRNVLPHSDTVRKIIQFNAVKTLKYGHLQRTLGSTIHFKGAAFVVIVQGSVDVWVASYF